MKVITGTVVDGKIELPAETVDEGSPVMVLTLEPGEPVRLTQAEEDELIEAMEQIRRGDSIDGESLLARLRSRLTA